MNSGKRSDLSTLYVAAPRRYVCEVRIESGSWRDEAAEREIWENWPPHPFHVQSSSQVWSLCLNCGMDTAVSKSISVCDFRDLWDILLPKIGREFANSANPHTGWNTHGKKTSKDRGTGYSCYVTTNHMFYKYIVIGTEKEKFVKSCASLTVFYEFHFLKRTPRKGFMCTLAVEFEKDGERRWCLWCRASSNCDEKDPRGRWIQSICPHM